MERPSQTGRAAWRWRLRGLALAAMALWTVAGGCAPDGGPSWFTVVALPDTQNYTDDHPEIFRAQTDWIVQNRERENIVFVTHLGDIVDNGPSERQWANADDALSRLDQAQIPYGTCLGNHDLRYNDGEFSYPATVDSSCSPFDDVDCSAAHYFANVGPQRFVGRPWYGGASPAGTSSFQLIEAGGFSLLFLHLAVDAPAAELAWAKQVLGAHPDAAVHITTHRYLYDLRFSSQMPFPLSQLTGGRYNDLIYLFDDPLTFNDGTTAEQLHQQLMQQFPNIFMVQCGHVDAELRQQTENSAGLPVHELLVDFQSFSENGGDGWLRLLRFDPQHRQVHVRTYSPTLGRFRDNAEGYGESLTALLSGIDRYADRMAGFVDSEQLKATIHHWQSAAGRAEGLTALYGDGRRDSDFVLQLDLERYATGASTQPP